MSATDDLNASGLAQLGELLTSLRRRWRLIAVIVIVAGVVALALTLRAPKRYDAVATVLISQANPIGSVLSRVAATPADPERDFNTRVALIREPAVAERVRRRLRLSASSDALLAQVSTDVAGSSDIAGIRVRDGDPRRAAAIANAFAREYVATREDAARDQVRAAVALAERQLGELGEQEQATAQGRELAQRLRELRIDAELQTGGVELVSAARPPTSPSTPRPVLNVGLAVVLAGLVGVGLAAALGLSDRRIHGEADVEALGLPLLGTVPAAGDDGSDAHAHEALSTVATSLRLLSLRRDVGATILTSPEPSDARAGVTLGIARALAELGTAVVVIEADLRRPRFARALGLPTTTGLSTLLAGFGDLDDVMVELDAAAPPTLDRAGAAPRLALIPAGPVAPSPLGLLADPAMGLVIARARERADVVIVDTAPPATSGDVATLAELTDGVVLLAELDRTHGDALQRALRTLAELHAPLLGLVLTNGPRPPASRYGDDDARATPTTPGLVGS